MRKHISIITIIGLIMCMNLSAIAFAEDDHGGEAHSPSMSVESGEEPISDMSTTEDTGRVDAGDVLGESSDDELADEEAVENEDAAEAETVDAGFSGGPSVMAYAGIGAAVIAIVVFVIIFANKGKKNSAKEKYRGKH